MLFAILSLLLIPIISKPEVRSMGFRPISKFFFWCIVFNCLILGWIGSKPVEYPFVTIGQICTIFYFFYFLCILPLIAFLEKFFWTNRAYLIKYNIIL
jgi:ubiquinol-cytochrome c reductase cytochrome b subunit